MLFTFRSQPFKTLYVAYVVLTVPLVRLPYWVIVSLLPSMRPRRGWSFGRALLVRFLRMILRLPFDIDLGPHPPDPEANAKSADKLGFVWIDPVPDDLVVGDVHAAAKVNNVRPVRISGYWFGKRDAGANFGHKASAGERVILALHGGGFIIGSAEPASPHTNIVNNILHHSNGLVERVLALEYRLSSSAPFKSANPFPAALLDAVAAYRYLVHSLGFQPENIVVQGDSAGGQLGINLVMYLVQAGFPTLPPPRGLLILSPAADWSNCRLSDPASSLVRARHTDYIDVFFTSGYPGRALCGSLPLSDLGTNPYLSPGSIAIDEPSGIFRGFPPTFLGVGEAELLRDVGRTIRDRLVADIGSGNVTYNEYPDTIHDWLFLPLEANGRKSLQDIQQWIVQLWRNGQ